MPYFVDTLESTQRLFAERGIQANAPGFYDSPAFLAQEQADPQFFNSYASFVLQQEYGAGYLQRVRQVVPIVSRILHRELVAEGRVGACIDMSMVLARILEREGIWNVMVKGGLTIKLPSRLRLETRYFWPFDVEQKPGHVWLSAPPFQVIDLTLKQQGYEPRLADRLPDHIIVERGERCVPTVTDMCSPEIRIEHADTRGRVDRELHFRLDPSLKEIFRLSPATQIYVNQVRLQYFPCGFAASDGDLDNITNQRWNGRYGSEIYREFIRPALEGL